MFFKKDYHVTKLEEQVWKSEMERLELEHKFELLMRERHKCEKSAIKAIKLRYEQFLEEDRQRMERNNNLLRMLERIDYQAATLAAKTERLKLLKAQHELYLMRNWNIQRAILPSFELPTPITQPTTENLPINFAQNLIPSQHLLLQQQQHQQQQQHNTSGTLLSSSALPAQQTIYYPPFKIPPQKGDTNEKSDFLKYLSQINQFHDIYDKNGMSDSTYQSDLNVKGIEDPPPVQHPFSRISNVSQMRPYPNAYYQDQITAIDSRFYGNNKFVPPSHPIEHRNSEIYDYLQQHQYQQKQQQQKNDTINNRTEFTEAIKPKLTNDEIIKTTRHHATSNSIGAPTTSSYKNSATTNDFLVNNSSNTQPDINNTAVSISNTSANASAINTNGVIKAIHQNKDENYVPPVRFQLNDNDAFNADDGENISGVAYSNAIGYVNRMSKIERPIRQASNENARINPMAIDVVEGMKEAENEHEKLTQQQTKNYEFSDVRPDIDKIEEVIYGEKINYLEIEEPIQQQQQQHHSSEEFNKPKHIIPSSTVARNDENVDIAESRVVRGMQQLNIDASESDVRNSMETISLNENGNVTQNRSDFHLPDCSADLRMTASNISLENAQMQPTDDANKFEPIYYEETETNFLSPQGINNPMYSEEAANYENQSSTAIHYQQPQPQNIDHESMSKVHQSQEVNYGLPVADTEDVSHATSFKPMQQGYQQTTAPQQQQQQLPGNYDNTFNHENQYTHGTQPYAGTEPQQEYQDNEYSEYSNQPEQTVEYNQSEYYSTEQQLNENGNSSYPAVDNENGNYDGQQYQQGNSASEEGHFQVPYYGGEGNIHGDVNTNIGYGSEVANSQQYQDQTYDNQNQHYQQQNLEQYTPDGQSERYADGQEYQEQQQQQQPQQQHIENVEQNYDAMYQQYTQDPSYSQGEYEYPQESHPPTEQYSSNAYYSEQPGENYYSDVNQMPANTLNLSSNNVQNSYMKSDAVNEITQPPTLTNVPVKHANDSQYENKYAPDGGEESSSTTYSENVNIPQQIFNGAVENKLPVGVQGNIIGNAESRVNVPPNYLESETDESSAAQQVKEMVNDESDFDFSAN